MQLTLILHNLRSTHNVGSLLRTADGLGASRIILSGYTPYPMMQHDSRLPHIAAKLDKQIHKTALGAEHSVMWQYVPELLPFLKSLKDDGYMIAALEQDSRSKKLTDFAPPEKLVLILGREVEGVEQHILETCDVILEIPMQGSKESFNVAVAGAIAAYDLLTK